MAVSRFATNEPFAVDGGDGDAREGGAGDTAPLDSVVVVSPCAWESAMWPSRPATSTAVRAALSQLHTPFRYSMHA